MDDISRQCQTVIWDVFPAESIAYDGLHLMAAFYKPIHTYVSMIVCILGSFCNFCNIIVLTRKPLRTPINLILTAMAINDSIVLFSNLIFTTHWSFAAYSNCSPENWSHGWAMFFISHAQISLVAHTSSVYLSVVIAFLRFRTLRNRGNMNAKPTTNAEAVGAIALTLVLVFTLNIPNMLTYKIIELPLQSFCNVTGTTSNATAFVPGISDIALNVDCAIFRAAFWISGVAFKVVPCALLFYFMLRLIRILNEIKRNRNRLLRNSCNELYPPSVRVGSPSNDHRDSSVSMNGNLIRNGQNPRRRNNNVNTRTDRTTRMLIVISAAFLFAELPQGILAVMSGIFSEHFRTNVYNSFGDIIDLLSLLNAFSSFFIYCVMSEQFRKEFVRVCIPNCIKTLTWKCVRDALFHPEQNCFGCVKDTVKPQQKEEIKTPGKNCSITLTVMGSETSVRKVTKTDCDKNGHRLSAPFVEFNSGSSMASSQTVEMVDECEHLLAMNQQPGSATPSTSESHGFA